MEFTREIVVPAVLSAGFSEIFGRIFSYLIHNFPWPTSAGARDAHRRRLQLLLIQIGSMVEEAQGRHITNQQLLAHLEVLTHGMCRGRFALDVSSLDDVATTTNNDLATTTAKSKRKLALWSPLGAGKRARLMTSETRLASVLEELEALARDNMLGSFIKLVQGYPRRSEVHRLVPTALYMDRCLFGRHMETERIVAFLLQRAPTAALSALAVVGDKRVGKTTLVRHVCHDDRVRGHFARIEWVKYEDVYEPGDRWDKLTYFARLGRILEVEEPRFGAVGRSLLVFQAEWHIDKSAWAALLARSKLAEGSKLVFICCDTGKQDPLNLRRRTFARTIGTAEPVVVRPLLEEEFWYYFKAFAFGGADPGDHPQLAAVGREIFRCLDGRSFFLARVLGLLLRENLDARFWRSVLASLVRMKSPTFGSRLTQPVPYFILAYSTYCPNSCYSVLPSHQANRLTYGRVLQDLLYVRGLHVAFGGWGKIRPNNPLTFPRTSPVSALDVLRAGPISTSVSGRAGEYVTIHCGQELYKDRVDFLSFKRIFKKKEGDP